MPPLEHAHILDSPCFHAHRAFGTTAIVGVAEPAALSIARGLLHDELDAVDRACSRFRADAEIVALQRADGHPVVVSDLLWELLRTAVNVAEWTCGTVDPTVGGALVALGYDRDFVEIPAIDERPLAMPVSVPGWWAIELDDDSRQVRIPPGMVLDLGATAKALAADRAAGAIATATGVGCLVNIGGDVAVAGTPPEAGWPIGIAVGAAADLDDVDTVVAVTEGGLASSGPSVRAWRRGGRELHHIVDPATGLPATPWWRLVSAAAPNCVRANAAATAAVVWGADAPGNLCPLDVAARLVGVDDRITYVGGWPADTERTER